MSDFDKEIIIHDYICETLSYQREGTDDSDTYNITGAYSLITGFANCQGYTDAFYAHYMADKFVIGKREAQQTAHTWNVVNIDGNGLMLMCILTIHIC